MPEQNEPTFASEKLLSKLRRSCPTPFFLYDEATILKRIRTVREAFSWSETLQILVPVRQNPIPEILRILSAAGTGAFCISQHDLKLAQTCGFSAQQTIYAPFSPQADTDALCSTVGAMRMIDGVHDLPAMPPERVMLGFRPHLERYAPSQLTRLFSQSKFGMESAELLDVAERFAVFRPRQFGIGVLSGRNEPEISGWITAAERLFAQAKELEERLHLTAQILCIGEGPGVNYRSSTPPADYASFGEQVRLRFERTFGTERPANLCILPGTWLLGPAGVYVMKTLDVKQGSERPIVLTDGTTEHFLRPSLFGVYHEITASGKEQDKHTQLMDVTGCLNDQRDRFGDRRQLPGLRAGNLLVVHDAGADGSGLRIDYCGCERAGEYLLRLDGTVQRLPLSD